MLASSRHAYVCISMTDEKEGDEMRFGPKVVKRNQLSEVPRVRRNKEKALGRVRHKKGDRVYTTITKSITLLAYTSNPI